ncbi:GGDEF domain-containing protein [Paenibacillus donghaensis]|uniref:GGDEF domain-containing protein n=1 Tax=Paenibacillus donghaensis TaxID=414771 RepID=A0A2Z2K866_9BACL|nr:GGDEF domain-containing protein [Paenibacillus donghaensis]ASA19415.1 hypothetical protein B9T62_00215 [Paenibacillus donghaensis]
MEELQIYILTICLILVAGLTAYLLLWLLQARGKAAPRLRAMHTGIAVLLIGGSLWSMHWIGGLSLRSNTGTAGGGGLYIPLAAYGLTLALLLFLFSRVRLLLAERDQLKELAYKDTLTGLLNNNGMNHFWDYCKENEQLAVLFLDLNRFKSINDKLGHHVGDLLLQAVGGELQQFSSKGKRHIFRIGGDEFVIVAKRCSQKEAEQLALRILEQTTKHYKLEQHNLFVSVSIGITLSHGKVDRIRLLKEADTAMYNAKQLGSGRYSFYKAESGDAYANWRRKTGSK